MVQYQSPIKIYKKPFELVMAAYEKRFPTSPLIPVFLGSEILSEYKSEDGAVHMVERRCQLAIDAPGWFKKMLGLDFVYFIQKNTLNRRDRSLVIEARNESFANKVSVLEICNYKVHPENGNWTAFDQEASLKIKSFLGLESAIEKFAMKNYLKNVDKGKEIIEHYLAELEKEGITHIPPWQGPPASASSGSPSSAAATTASDATAKSVEEEVPVPKLESDYMRRYLGDLSTKEESEFTLFRSKVFAFCKKHSHPVPEAAVMLRFLRAREFNSDKALEMISRSLYWRHMEGADSVLTTWETPKVIAEYLPGGWHKSDLDGRPVFVLRIGQLDVKGLVRSVSEEDLMKQLMFINETGMKLAKEATEKLGKPVSDFTCIVDFEGLGMKHLWRPGISIFQKLITQDTANYPETMNKLLVVRAPLLFPVAWSIVRNVFDERTRNKIVILGDNFLEQLASHIPAENIPAFLGGPSATGFSAGGPVPKSFYLDPNAGDESDTQSMLSADHTSMYKETSIGRSSTFRVPFHVSDADTVITWDFFVHAGADIGFGIFYSPESLDIDAHASELVEVEKTQRYKDSVQGTFVCNRPGLYVLRWDNTYSWVTSKTLSYYADLIGSELYRRSLSSLLSVSTSASLNSIDTTETSTSTTTTAD